ncbi:MAG: hypothetical protein Q9M48_07220 [Rhodobacterales bacterium]|nr:hypothetical protein [Rhodobacterales bacterium]
MPKNVPIWADKQPAPIPYPTLKIASKQDVVVIGGGLTGLTRIIHQTPGISFRRTGSAGLTAAF